MAADFNQAHGRYNQPMIIKTSIDTRAIADIGRKMKVAQVKMTRKTAVRAVKRSMNIPLNVARNIVPVRGGALKRSLTTIVRVFGDNKRGMVWGALGIKGKYNEPAPAGVKTKSGMVRPPLYGHLVELGHDSVRRDSLSVIGASNSQSLVKNRYDKNIIAIRQGDVLSGTKYARVYSKAKAREKKNMITEAKSKFAEEGFLRPALRNSAGSMVTTFARVIDSELADCFNGVEGVENVS